MVLGQRESEKYSFQWYVSHLYVSCGHWNDRTEEGQCHPCVNLLQLRTSCCSGYIEVGTRDFHVEQQSVWDTLVFGIFFSVLRMHVYYDASTSQKHRAIKTKILWKNALTVPECILSHVVTIMHTFFNQSYKIPHILQLCFIIPLLNLAWMESLRSPCHHIGLRKSEI